MPPDVDTSVTWSPSPPLGSIDGTGLYTPPASVGSIQSVIVTATSVADPTKSASAQVWVFPPVSVAISPTAATLGAGQNQKFAALVENANKPAAANWSVTPAGIGAVQSGEANVPNSVIPIPAGTYCAPGVIASPRTVTITATSAYDDSKVASALVNLVPSVALSVSPATATRYASETQQFTPVLNYTTTTPVAWSISPKAGSISEAGLYAVPAMVTYRQTITVTASIYDWENCGGQTYTATATVTLVPHVLESITAPSGLTASTVSNSQINLSWIPSAAPGGSIAGYNVFRSGVWVGSSAGTSYSDLGLAAGTAYAYTVAAYDTNGNTSLQSASAGAATLSGIPANLVAYYNFNGGRAQSCTTLRGTPTTARSPLQPGAPRDNPEAHSCSAAAELGLRFPARVP
jgi:hypothetical protein